MSLTRADVEKVAILARLDLTEAEIVQMTGQLRQIIDYVQQLSAIDTDDVEPMAHAVEMQNVLADDVVQPSLPREFALANAPRHNNRGYLAPAVLGD